MNTKYPDALENLIESFEHLPSVGRKTAERYALHVFMHMKDEDIIEKILLEEFKKNYKENIYFFEKITKEP